jgi:hypothetical protein
MRPVMQRAVSILTGTLLIVEAAGLTFLLVVP